ncbi:M23 family metallopeptidase [Croceibacterium xixiisoli]|nr:M23 family metallopeptidase [Croceibacterium xixiisoli]
MRRAAFSVAVAMAALLTVAACVAPSPDNRSRDTADAAPVTTAPPPAALAPPLQPVQPTGPANFAFAGELTQGGWIRGQVPGGAVSASLSGKPLTVTADGRFFAAFDRDAGTSALLRATLRNGQTIDTPLTITPRAWKIEHVNVARAPGGATEAFMARRRPELARIEAARAVNAPSDGWAQDFIWPATGRISGRFGSQRVYRGEPAAYHSGLDIAARTGTPFVAPADGVVVLAAESPFSLEGYLLIIDHGMGLNSAFLHCSKIVVREGERVRQGQHIGDIGATGRATGPHLHWGIKWNDTRLDPLLFLGPMG